MAMQIISKLCCGLCGAVFGYVLDTLGDECRVPVCPRCAAKAETDGQP